ncbi:DUF6114 domain-containing protein [Actinocorallia sp. API 0066]|uniref:DUF6114 domain-containing protein n=1 Tax=Actinocorallia sp. API 0066 TaxID=2896846 RepID=UPI001E450800|nr:DUF6114 domain-containing protein [Actinocorallia sp. API 0066]MCD0451791.1 DUF6114 domain-containing protein [Actinocorallia sp. API 0066]
MTTSHTEPQDLLPRPATPGPSRRRAATRRARPTGPLGRAWRWFRAFRRSRPFWGGVWLTLGGWMILRLTLAPVQTAVTTGFNGIAGWLVGGGMILCGLIPWAAPSQRYTFGVIGTILAVVSLVTSNMGGFLLGMLFGVVGGTLMVAWGKKKPNRGRPVARTGR